MAEQPPQRPSLQVETGEISNENAAATATAAQRPRKNWLVSHPRTASNLLTKILNLDAQPRLLSNVQKSYFFLPSMMTRHNSSSSISAPFLDSWTHEKRTEMRDALQRGFDNLQNHVRAVAEHEGSKDVFVKEHLLFVIDPAAELEWVNNNNNCNNNQRNGTDTENDTDEKPWTMTLAPSTDDGNDKPHAKSTDNVTVYPDIFLRQIRPTFLIRHPAQAFPSLYRANIDTHGLAAARADPRLPIELSFAWLRRLYDWYSHSSQTHDSITPLILDAEDMLSPNGPDLLKRYANEIGLDPSRLVFEWAPTPTEKLEGMSPVERRMLSTISASTGIIASPVEPQNNTEEKKLVPELDEKEVEKWKVEFGHEDAQRLEGWVRSALGDYAYLKERRFR